LLAQCPPLPDTQRKGILRYTEVKWGVANSKFKKCCRLAMGEILNIIYMCNDEIVFCFLLMILLTIKKMTVKASMEPEKRNEEGLSLVKQRSKEYKG
jgi:hypothetical protein